MLKPLSLFKTAIYQFSKKYRRLSRYFFHTKEKISDPGAAVVNFGEFLLNMDMGRYSFILCQLFKFSGFPVIIKLYPAFFNKQGPYREMLLTQVFARVRRVDVAACTITLPERQSKKKIIKLVYGYDLIENKIEAYYLPYTLHPRFYQTYNDNTNFQTFRMTVRTAGIIFAGNFERSAYSRTILKDDFEGIISRVEVLDYISAKYSRDSRVIYPETIESFYRSLEEEKSSSLTFIISQVKTPVEDWLAILSKGNFYLCLPGGAMPWSHNAIEAMAVGTIPIIQYNHLFYPPLTHLKNCIAFYDYESLNEAIEVALNMDDERLDIMRQQVVNYYNDYLATEQTTKRIQDFYHSDEEVMTIALPFLPRKLY